MIVEFVQPAATSSRADLSVGSWLSPQRTGQRQVRIAERHKSPTLAFHYSKAVKLQVGQKVVFTTEGFLPCEPARDPLQVDKQMRIKLPGKPWQEWVTWTSSTQFIMEC